jgi:hypothetical protein
MALAAGLAVSLTVAQVAHADEPHDHPTTYIHELSTADLSSSAVTGHVQEPGDLAFQMGGLTFLAREGRSAAKLPLPSPSPTTGPQRRDRPSNARLLTAPEPRSQV